MSKYCPNCGLRVIDDDLTFCGKCGSPLVTEPSILMGKGISVGDAAAISGGLNVHDSHNMSTVNTVTNNITNIAPQKSDMDTLQEKKNVFMAECKRAYEDGILEPIEEVALEECRIKIGLPPETAKEILDTVRLLADRNNRKTSLNPIAKTKLKILSDNLQNNNVTALHKQLGNMEAIVNKYEHDELSRKYFLALAVLNPRKSIELKELSPSDSYWKLYWSYLAYIKENETDKAEVLLAGLDRFAEYPEDNLTILAAAGSMMSGNRSEAREYLQAVTGDYTPELQRFVDSVYLVVDPEMAKEMGADPFACAFFLVNMFGQKDPKAVAAEEAERKAKAEAERKAKEEAERKEREEAECKAKEEAKRKAKAEAERKAKEEAERKEREEAERKAKEEAKRKAKAEAERKAKEEVERKEREEAERKAKEEAERKAKTVVAEKSKDKGNSKSREEGFDRLPSRPGKEVSLMDKALASIDKQDFETAIRILKKLSNSGEPQAQYELAKCYEDGKGVKQNTSVAAAWLNKSAANGYVPAFFALGKRNELGIGISPHQEQAAKWYRKAAEQGYASAQFSLGLMYDEGRGITQNRKKAIELIKSAANNGSQDAKDYINHLKDKPSAIINKVRIENDVIYNTSHHGLRLYVDFTVMNMKGKVFNCSIHFYHDWQFRKFDPKHDGVNVYNDDPKELSYKGRLAVGLNGTATSNEEICNNWTFTVPYYILCNHDSKGKWDLFARVIIWDFSHKYHIQLDSLDKKFTIICKKKLFSSPTYEVIK